MSNLLIKKRSSNSNEGQIVRRDSVIQNSSWYLRWVDSKCIRPIDEIMSQSDWEKITPVLTSFPIIDTEMIIKYLSATCQNDSATLSLVTASVPVRQYLARYELRTWQDSGGSAPDSNMTIDASGPPKISFFLFRAWYFQDDWLHPAKENVSMQRCVCFFTDCDFQNREYRQISSRLFADLRTYHYRVTRYDDPFDQTTSEWYQSGCPAIVSIHCDLRRDHSITMSE